MWATLYLLLMVLSAGATWAWAVRERAIAFTTLMSVVGWSILAIQGSSIEIYHQDGSSTTVQEPALQYVFVGVAVLAFFAFVLWYFGEYPVQGSDSSRSAPDTIGEDGRANSEGL